MAPRARSFVRPGDGGGLRVPDVRRFPGGALVGRLERRLRPPASAKQCGQPQANLCCAATAKLYARTDHSPNGMLRLRHLAPGPWRPKLRDRVSVQHCRIVQRFNPISPSGAEASVRSAHLPSELICPRLTTPSRRPTFENYGGAASKSRCGGIWVRRSNPRIEELRHAILHQSASRGPCRRPPFTVFGARLPKASPESMRATMDAVVLRTYDSNPYSREIEF